MRELKDENIEGLEKLFNRVLKCKKCGIKYGSDLTKRQETGICPRCQLEIEQANRKKKK